MGVSYKKLWHILVDRGMKKKDLKDKACLTEHTMKRLAHEENVTAETLLKISRALDCTIDDIVDYSDDFTSP